ncbi:butyrophilin subfamily 2 member A1-like isoform X3 [Colossoma macropomum]|uniref:butyrophilin subfamily 2 member A1-like isoform X3 n=1 Tax=Colossoma macropomum TaxID=42526 RepID=UPI001863A1B7|nr:butyrophilin subfamily 2 member A1-like isoform X3 [Colossoma macropomum]
MLLLLLIFDLLSCSNADTFSLVVPDDIISGHLGSSVVLPCELSTMLDIRSYEVRWYRPSKFDNPVLLYGEVQENTGDPQYRGRASLIGDLQKGNVSLKLENLTVADRGEYMCYVKSYKWYEKASIFLSLPVVGSPLLLSFAGAGEQVNVTCASGGWSPKPTLTWRDKGGRELTDSVNYDYTDSERLVSVSSWLLLSPSESEWISCSVGLSDQEMRESRVLPLKSVHQSATKTDSTTEPGVSPGWKVATILLLISLLVLTVMTIIFLKFRGHIFKKGTKSTPAEEEACRLVGPETANKETNTDTEIQVDLSPPSCPVCAVREINRTDGATQTSGDLNRLASPVREMNITNETTPTSDPETAKTETSPDKDKQEEFSPPSCPVCAGREINRADGATQTSADFNSTSCPVCAVREINKTDRATQTSGEFNPPSSPVSAVKGMNRTDGTTQTDSGPETGDKETNKDKEVQAGPETESKQRSKDEEMRGPATANKGTSKGQELQASAKSGNKTITDPEKPDWEEIFARKVAIKPYSSPTVLGVLFKERMCSGQYYWEVTGLTALAATPTASLKKPSECPTSWHIGVTNQQPEMIKEVALTPQNGCWVLHYEREKGYYVNDPSQTSVLVRDRFSKLGVFLDCDKQTLSFYNCDKSSHLYTFYNVHSTTPLIPVIHPGLKPRYTLEISQMKCVKCDELYPQH